MMELWGTDACTDCKIARMWLEKTPLEWRYVDVSQIKDYQGQIPMLVTDEGLRLFGFGPIKGYVTRKLTEMGFSSCQL